MSDATNPALPYTYTVTVVTGVGTGGLPVGNVWQVQGAFVNINGEQYTITDVEGNVVAAVHAFGTVITRNDAATLTTPGIT